MSDEKHGQAKLSNALTTKAPPSLRGRRFSLLQRLPDDLARNQLLEQMHNRGLRPHRRPPHGDRAHRGDDLTTSRVRLPLDRHSPPRTPNQQRHNGSHGHDRGSR